MKSTIPPRVRGYALFEDDKPEVPKVSRYGEDGSPLVFFSEREAEKQIARITLVKMQRFMDGYGDFDEAMTMSVYYLPVEIDADGSVITAAGKRFPAKAGALARNC